MNTDFRAVNAAYDQDYINGISEHEYSALFNFLQEKGIKSVLDLAGGSGKLAQRLLKNGMAVTLFDIANNMIERAIANGFPKENTLCDDFFEHHFDKTYDCVILKSAMHEIPKEKMAEFHGKILGLLHSDGWFIDFDVHQPNEESALWLKKLVNTKDTIAGLEDLVRNRAFYTETEIQHSLNERGFAHIQTIHRFFYTISVKKFGDMYWDGESTKGNRFTQAVTDLLVEKPTDIFLQKKNNNDIIIKIPAIIMVAQKVR